MQRVVLSGKERCLVGPTAQSLLNSTGQSGWEPKGAGRTVQSALVRDGVTLAPVRQGFPELSSILSTLSFWGGRELSLKRPN